MKSNWRDRYFKRLLTNHSNPFLPSQFVSIGLFSAMALLCLCVIIRPDSLAVNYGLSYFGIFLSTVVPYAAAFMLYAFCLWQASVINLDDIRHSRFIGWIMRIMSIQIIGLILTPFNRLYNVHVFFGAGLFSLQLLLSVSFIVWIASNWLNVTLVLIEFLSGVASLYYLPQAHGLLLQTQVIFQFAFGLLLIRTLTKIEVSDEAHSLHQLPRS